jgi:thiamine-phosphate pyrophosphorylase
VGISPQLHLVTDSQIPRGQLLAAIRAAAENGVDWVQVRDHQASARELYDLTSEIIAIARPPGARVAVNDRIDVALAAGADGVQLGERSLSVAVTRRLAPGLQLGASVHGVARATWAAAEGADWLTFGHVFATSSHPGEPPRGLDELARVVQAVHCPVIAIGGISPDQISAVLAAGAAGVAVMSAILRASDPGQATRLLRSHLARPRDAT